MVNLKAEEKLAILIEALPYIKRYKDKIVVIKYGGSVMAYENLTKRILEDVYFLTILGMRPIFVHGGGPMISERMRQKGVEPKFVKGHRVTDEKSLALIKAVLLEINASVCAMLKGFGVKSVAVTPGENTVVKVSKKDSHKSQDLGFVGTVHGIDTEKLEHMVSKKMLPVICSIAEDEKGQLYNINADEVAQAVASHMKAEKIVLLTNVKGVMTKTEGSETLYSRLTVSQVKDLTERNIITHGMIPKVDACVKALTHGVKKAHIIDAKVPHALLLEIFTDAGVGTEIVVK
jgi:acetylglutamate kinase